MTALDPQWFASFAAWVARFMKLACVMQTAEC
jgi:hypothetical protein